MTLILLTQREFLSAGGDPIHQQFQTPVMLVHGTLDFIPIQQAEEFFTALMRQDKRAVRVRYRGEGHGPVTRQNFLDLWTRIPAWFDETMRPSR